MSSSSSDSDSDEFEPIRKIKINIRPKEDSNRKVAADVSEIKASVESWRPLGPPTHPSLSRRQSSLSSMSSMSFGTAGSSYGATGGCANLASNVASASQTFAPGPLKPSPSCMSLVNDFNNRSSFSNFVPTSSSRTSSPLMHSNQNDNVPIAIAIQESIDLIVKGIYDPDAIEPKFQSRMMGNIKVAFPNAFARVIAGGSNHASLLKLHFKSTENITKYYASRLIRDLNPEANGKTETLDAIPHHMNERQNTISSISGTFSNNKQAQLELLNLGEKKFNSTSDSTNKCVEFDMDLLSGHLKKMHDHSPASRYYNVDVLRYQIAPLKSIEECPLLACAYWKMDANMVKMRIDFKHSSKSGIKLDCLREISFTASFAQFFPSDTTNDINSLMLDSHSSSKSNNNNNSGALNMNSFENLIDSSTMQSNAKSFSQTGFAPPMGRPGDRYNQLEPSFSSNPSSPQITHKPQAIWNNSIKQLTWKFDTLTTDGMSSLFAKLDFRICRGIPQDFLEDRKPTPVDVKFLVVDSTLSNISLIVDSAGYKMSFLKREIRSGRYKVEPHLVS